MNHLLSVVTLNSLTRQQLIKKFRSIDDEMKAGHPNISVFE